MNIGDRIKFQRRKKELTQKQVAEQLDISIDMVKSIEQGRKFPSIENIIKLADLFEVSVDYILGRTVIPNEFEFPNHVIEHVIKELKAKHNINIEKGDKREVNIQTLIDILEDMEKDTP